MTGSARPSELELQILSVLWDHGPLAVRDVLNRMPDGKERAYTTILSTMQVMEKKGLLSHSRRGTAHIFQPQVERSHVVQPLMQQLVQNVFGGKPSAVLQCLLDASGVDDDELKAIRKLVRGYSPPAGGEGEES